MDIADPLKPRGFGGYVDNLQELPAQGARVLRLPAEGEQDGPFLRIPEGLYSTILVEGLVESLGGLDAFLADACAHLQDQGLLLVDMENLQGPRSLRFLLEGRTGNLDPFGSVTQVERRVHGPRVLRGLAQAGLLVQDVIQVPAMPNEVGPDCARQMISNGFLALSYVGQVPANRWWLVARKSTVKEGSVLLGPGGPQEQGQTERCLRAFLPENWEIVTCQGEDEGQAINKALPRSSGEILWFLRAGSQVDVSLFRTLLARVDLSPAAPGNDEELAQPGDLNGLMATRHDWLVAGPIPDHWRCVAVAYEDWLMRLGTHAHAVHGVSGGMQSVSMASPDPKLLKEESQQLFDKWQAVEGESHEHPSQLDPQCRQDNVKVAQWQGREPRVSLCMITKNEEEFLAACLASVQDVVDEMIIVDTGSTDGTVEIAQSFGAKVLHHPWQESFSEARNVALAQAKGDWVLSLDGDESIRVEQHEEFRSLLRDPGVVGYHLNFHNTYTDAETTGVIMVRLFRRLPGVLWQNRIHEQITPTLVAAGDKDGMALVVSDIVVDHQGYLDRVMESKGKNERNERLFQLQIEDTPEDVYALYKYGDFLRRTTERWGQAKDCLRQAFDLVCAMPPGMPRTIPYAGEIGALLALEYNRAQQPEEAMRIIETALRKFTATPNLHYIAAGLELAAGHCDAAIQHYKRCLAFRDQVLIVPIQEGVTSYVSITGIAQAYLAKGDRQKARRMLQQSLTLNSAYEVTHLVLSRMQFDEGDLQGALATLTAFLKSNPEAAGACNQATLILLKMGLVDQAQAMGDKAISLFNQRGLEFESRQLKKVLSSLCGGQLVKEN